jgi:hypothetical protein
VIRLAIRLRSERPLLAEAVRKLAREIVTDQEVIKIVRIREF